MSCSNAYVRKMEKEMLENELDEKIEDKTNFPEQNSLKLILVDSGFLNEKRNNEGPKVGSFVNSKGDLFENFLQSPLQKNQDSINIWGNIQSDTFSNHLYDSCEMQEQAWLLDNSNSEVEPSPEYVSNLLQNSIIQINEEIQIQKIDPSKQEIVNSNCYKHFYKQFLKFLKEKEKLYSKQIYDQNQRNLLCENLKNIHKAFDKKKMPNNLKDLRKKITYHPLNKNKESFQQGMTILAQIFAIQEGKDVLKELARIFLEKDYEHTIEESRATDKNEYRYFKQYLLREGL